MSTLLLTIFLMFTIVWSYKTLHKNFNNNSEDNTAIDPSADSKSTTFSKILTLALLFLGCFLFVSIATKKAATESEPRYGLTAAEHRKIYELIETMEQQKQSQQSKANNPIEIILPNQVKTKFSDVAGLLEAKDEVLDIVKFLHNPEEFRRLGAKSPKGILLYGPPGTGKTLLARAIAGEAGVSFIAVSGSQFEEEYVGVGASRIRNLFATARQNTPCIIFIDEIDAVAFKRKPKDPSWAAQTVNQLLAELDGLNEDANENIVLIGASNRMEVLDPAIMRPGRLDRHIKINAPTKLERAQILEIHLAKIKFDPDTVSAEKIAKMTPNFSAAELANLVNEAAIIATKRDKQLVDIKDFDEAKDRVILGSKRSAVKMTEKELKLTAYHEAGHALVGYELNKQNGGKRFLYKVTIAPRGPSLGHTSFESSTDDEFSMSYTTLNSMIAMSLGGRIAEEMVFGSNNVTTGAESDLQNATSIAYRMVTVWGFSPKVGLLNTEIGDSSSVVSDSVIQSEVKRILDSNYVVAKNLLMTKRDKLDKLASALLEHETLDAQEVEKILQ
jgi:ATP-dependent metalloprotease FtsH